VNSTTFLTKRLVPDFSAYLELCKPKVVLLMLLTALVGMCLATSSAVPVYVLFWGNLGIALAAGAAAAVNHVIDRHIDIMMKRTQNRPIAQGKVSAVQALLFSFVLAVAGLGILYFLINPLSAVLTGMALIGYAGIYTLYL
jgi:protoheme IX farnesyltransferase